MQVPKENQRDVLAGLPSRVSKVLFVLRDGHERKGLMDERFHHNISLALACLFFIDLGVKACAVECLPRCVLRKAMF